MTRATASNFLLTGPSGVGKSFLLQKVVQRLSDLHCRGFISETIVGGATRTGWRLQGLNSESGILAHTEMDSPRRMGRYGVDLDLFSRIARTELRFDCPVDLFAIDEIGIISSWDTEAETLIEHALSSPIPAVVIVRKKGRGFASEVRGRSDVEIRGVTQENRDQLVDDVVAWIRDQ